MGMEKIKDAIISKVEAEAEGITKEARERAQEEIEKAEKQRDAMFEAEKNRIVEEVEEEAARIRAQASIKARQKISSAKADIIAEIVKGARKQLSRPSGADSDLANLIKEAVEALGGAKGRIYVASRDMEGAKKLLDADRDLSESIREVKEADLIGGVIAEDLDGKLRIDNTYETRLEMLLPRLLPEISKELFGSS